MSAQRTGEVLHHQPKQRCWNSRHGSRGFVARPMLERYWEKVDKRGPDECWPWMGSRDFFGRGLFHRDGKITRAPRVAWFLHYGVDLPPKVWACHRCDNAWCVNPLHLFAGTDADNLRDMCAKGRRKGPVGREHPHAKLTEAKVVEMRQRFLDGERKFELVRRFGVSFSVVSKIVTGRMWKHVPMPSSPIEQEKP